MKRGYPSSYNIQPFYLYLFMRPFQSIRSDGSVLAVSFERTAGIDGCKNGWVLVRPDGNGAYRWKARSSFEQLMEEENDLELVLVDMPIGLSSGANSGKNAPFRTMDWRLKEQLRGHSSSVFIPPTREAARAPSKGEAHERNRELLGSALQPPSAGIREKVDELDRYLIEHPVMKSRIRESHPELTFQRLNGNEPLSQKKSEAKGILERIQLLSRWEGDAVPPQDLSYLAGDIEIGVEPSSDDLVDALGLAVIAKHSADKTLQLLALPNEPSDPSSDSKNVDAAGIRIELLFPA